MLDPSIAQRPFGGSGSRAQRTRAALFGRRGERPRVSHGPALTRAARQLARAAGAHAPCIFSLEAQRWCAHQSESAHLCAPSPHVPHVDAHTFLSVCGRGLHACHRRRRTRPHLMCLPPSATPSSSSSCASLPRRLSSGNTPPCLSSTGRQAASRARTCSISAPSFGQFPSRR